MKKKRRVGILLSFLMMFSMLFQGMSTTVFAEGTPKNVEATVTSFTIQNLSGEDVDKVYWTDKFYLAIDWDAGANGAGLHEGDYFDITLPDEMVFPSDSASVDFNIYGDDGTTVIAKAHVNPGSDDKGGTVRVTFTDWVEGKENVNGNIRLSAQFDREQVTTGEENTFQISVNGQVVPVTVTVTGPKPLNPEFLGKWGQSFSGSKEQAEWYVRINHQKSTLTNVVISDHLSEGTGSETYIADSFILLRVEMDEYGDVLTVYETVDLTDKLSIAPDKKSFTLTLGDLNGDQYRLRYRTTYTPGTTLRNNMSLTSTEQNKTVSATHISADSGGSGTGTLANKIKLTKVDADDNSIVLKDAVFTVTGPDESTFELTTGNDGTVTSGPLTSGTYKVKEKTPPSGYKLNEEEYTLQVTSSGGALQTITDEPVKISVAVNKTWVGPEGAAVTVHLLADGADTGKTVTLDANNGWSGSFDDLRQYNADGTEIQYYVAEDEPTNYKADVTGNMNDGYTITNTNIEKVAIPVTKTWVGPKAGPVEVKLLADDQATDKTITLDEASEWKGVFEDLPKYDENDGHEIVYTIEEVNVDGYITGITGTVADGFTITNTITGKVSVPVTKSWVGPEADSVTIHLFADDEEVDSVVLDADHQWQHTFTDLEQYKDGVEIQYTIQEDEIENYQSEIIGDATGGFTVKNTNMETITIPVVKNWVGQEAPVITIILLADGKEEDRDTLTKEDGWTLIFEDLPKYDLTDGHEIIYTIQEVKIDGYTTGISGTAEDGFTITNTITGRVSVPVTKKWVGTAAGSITVNLYADGKKVDSQKLSKDNNWQYTFKDLDQYKDGKEITYTIEEEKVAGYSTTITGDAKNGYTITNTEDTPPKKTTTPKTGDSSSVGSFAGLLMLSGTLLIILGSKRRKEKLAKEKI